MNAGTMISKSVRLRLAASAPAVSSGSTVLRRYVGLLRGWMWTPSACWPATRSIHGLTAARSIGGSGASMGPGDHMAGRRVRS
jgi:hypothetical protein